jgi:Mlc titration factor MtfA (ptsG expression regulator)
MARLGGLLGSVGKGCALDATAWSEVTSAPVFDGLSGAQFERLGAIAQELLRKKQFTGAAGLALDAAMATAIAVFAALPVLELGADAYGDWVEVIVYPGEFLYEGHETDPDGIVHHVRHARSGEAMAGGPLVLSWQDVMASGGGEGFNVVIHEFAHKLDMKNGAVDGLPPLHSGMSVAVWSAAFNAAYDDFRQRVERGEEPEIDPYAAESPAEFFAVLTEYFFEAPDFLDAAYPAVYQQMKLYFKQDPLARLESLENDPATS